jgi:hypothetical protein
MKNRSDYVKAIWLGKKTPSRPVISIGRGQSVLKKSLKNSLGEIKKGKN